MEQEEVHEITIQGVYDVIIDHYEEGLRVTTHKNTRVKRSGTTLSIVDPQTTDNNSFNNVSIGKGSYIVMTNGSVVIQNNHNTRDEEKKKRTPPPKEHLIPCQYNKIQRVVSQGAASTKFLVPLDLIDCRITATGSGQLKFTAQQSMANLIVKMTGSGGINLYNSMVKCATVHLTGSGSVKNFVIHGDASLNLTGSGSINCDSLQRTRISQHTVGSGRIKVKGQQEPL